MTSPHLPSLAVVAAALGLTAALPAQGYIAMTATQIPQTNAPAGVADFGLASRADGSWLLFGGQQANGLLAGTYTASNGVWQQRVSLFNPALRTGHQLAFDAVRGDSVMFGGKDVLGNALSDTWVYANDQWSYRPTPSPSARFGHRMCFDAARGVVVLFGGKDSSQTLLADTWTWNGSAWAQAATSTAPAARLEHGMAYDAYRQKVVLFGGEAATGLQNDVWDWDGASWTQVVVPPVGGQPFGPLARKQHAMGYDAVTERVVLFGGLTLAGGPSNEVWAFDGVQWLGLSGVMPSARSKACLALNMNGRSRLFGGVGLSGLPDDCWEFPIPFASRELEYGSACSGSGGPLRLAATAGSQCALGANFVVRLSGFGSPLSACVGFLGLSRDYIAGLPLPLDLSFVGIPGCSALNSADFSIPIGTPAGSPLGADWSLAIPNDSYFLGIDLFLQGLTLEPIGFSRFATVTNGVEARIGLPTSSRPSSPDPALNMVLIPSGTFAMGSAAIGGAAAPVRNVSLVREFWVGKYEVTQAQYQSLMGVNPSYFQGSFPSAPSRPVERVTWNDAMAYCAALNAAQGAAGRIPPGYQYRLPTEAEWECICRAGTSTEWNTGAALLCGQANIQGCNIPQNTVVGAFPPNAWGIHEVHGNVWEWCLDSWDGSSNYGSAALINPYVSAGPYRILRGGSWVFGANFARSAFRLGVSPGVSGNDIGFRVVLAPILVP